jgi:hypothetical protein
MRCSLRIQPKELHYGNREDGLHRSRESNWRVSRDREIGDGQIDLNLYRPIEMGGKRNWTNAEQLFCRGICSLFHRGFEGSRRGLKIYCGGIGASRASNLPVLTQRANIDVLLTVA